MTGRTESYRVGLTADCAEPDGRTIFGDVGLERLTAAGLVWEVMAPVVGGRHVADDRCHDLPDQARSSEPLETDVAEDGPAVGLGAVRGQTDPVRLGASSHGVLSSGPEGGPPKIGSLCSLTCLPLRLERLRHIFL